MKIAIDARMYSWPGIGRYTRNLLSELEQIDHEHTYLVLLRKADLALYHPKNKNFKKVEADYREFSLQEQLQFAFFLYKLKPDLVHFTNFNQPILYLRRHISNIHDLTLIDYKNIRASKGLYHIKYFGFRLVMRRAARSSMHILTISNYVRKSIIARYRLKPAKVSTTYPAVGKLSSVTKPYILPKKQPFILYVGAAYPFKNLERLIKAFGTLRQNHPDLQLVLAGKKDFFYDQLEAQVKKQDLTGVVFTGHVEDSQLAWLYHHALVYVFPSLSEGFGLPGLEAMQFNLPVVSSNATCLPEVYGKAAEYFNPEDETEIVKAIENVISKPKLRKSLMAEGELRIKQYSWSKMAQQTLDIYNKLH